MPDQESELQKQLAECTLQKSYMFSVACVCLAIPVSLRLKSYNPLAIGVLAGTMLDLLNGRSCLSAWATTKHSFSITGTSTFTGYNSCTEERQALEAYQRALREQK